MGVSKSPRRQAVVVAQAAVVTLALAFANLGAAPPAAGAQVEGCTPWDDTQPTELTKRHTRASVACLVNLERAAYGLGALDHDRKLQRAAQRHSKAMRGNCFDHHCSGEPGLRSRLRQTGYLSPMPLRFGYSENIAWGGGLVGTPRRMVEAWMASPEHRAQILSPLMRDLGIGFAKGTPRRRKGDGGLYTIDFGYRVR